ncbi:hypothetical protein QTP86_004084 [Hemibagrus guttatus]|nr:hypothetical protein QTP86_004084 [Hemibagrus guttatus]
MGLHSRRPVSVPMLTLVHYQKHQQWEREHQNWTMKQWKKVAWSDESRFPLHHMDGRVHVHRLLGEHMAPGCTMRRRQAGGGSVMLWAMFCWETLGPAIHVDVTLTRTTYPSIFAEFTTNMLRKRQGCGTRGQTNVQKCSQKLNWSQLSLHSTIKTLSQSTVTRCMNAALAPLRLQGIRVLNNLDDRLILAHSKAMAASHRDVVLAHMRSLGLGINPEKCVLSSSQRTTFLGVIWDSTMMRACLSPARVTSILSAVNSVQLDQSLSVTEVQRVLGLMEAAANVIPLGLLHMRLFQFWLRGAGFYPHRHPLDASGLCAVGFVFYLRGQDPGFWPF